MSKSARWGAIIAVTLVAAWWGLRVSASGKWTAVNGKILNAEVITQKIQRLAFSNSDSFSDQFEVALAYEYSVSGSRYVGHNLFADKSNVFGRKDTALKFVAQFSAGKTASVFYDPSDPNRACLIPQATLPISGYLALLLGLALILIVIGLVMRFVARNAGESTDTKN